MKKALGLLLALVLALGMAVPVFAEQPAYGGAAVVAMAAAQNAADGIARFPQKRVNIVKNKKLKIPAVAYSKSGKAVKLTYKSSKKSVATVNAKTGEIRAKAVGTATITASGKGVKSAKLTVKVVKKSVPVEDVEISYWKSGTLFIGQSKAVVASVKPSKATGKKLTYKSSNPYAARVSSAGVVTAVGTGRTTISVTCGKISKSFYVDCGKKPTQLNKTVYDKNGIKIVADMMEFDIGNSDKNRLHFTVYNNSNYYLVTTIESVKINGYTVSTEYYNGRLAINSRNSGSQEFTISRSGDLSKYPIDEINRISLVFRMGDFDLFGSPLIDYSDVITLNV